LVELAPAAVEKAPQARHLAIGGHGQPTRSSRTVSGLCLTVCEARAGHGRGRSCSGQDDGGDRDQPTSFRPVHQLAPGGDWRDQGREARPPPAGGGCHARPGPQSPLGPHKRRGGRAAAPGGTQA
ncbi:unnamed protein product, partial [Ectocarpus fasciculatus]